MQTDNITMLEFRENINFNAEIIEICFIIDLHLFQGSKDACLLVLCLKNIQPRINSSFTFWEMLKTGVCIYTYMY